MESMGAVTIAPAQASPQEASGMYGLIVKLTVVPGRREEMIGILKESAADMSGCFSYVVARDSADENVIWVTEVWDRVASHEASLSLPSVKNVIPRAKALVASFERISVTSPVWGVGLPAAQPD
jgi:quinol monooxygenase YgiN